MKKSTASRTIFMIINYILLIATSLICLLPFVNLLAISFSDSAASTAGKVTFWPVNFTTKSYEFIITGGAFFPALWVSVKRVLLGVFVNMVLMVLTAYPLSKTKAQLRGRNIYMIFFVITMLIGGGLIPTYLLVVRLGLLDSIWALILPGALPVYNMIILMNFMRTLPVELEEAAMIDGAGPFTVLVRVILPLLTPALATVGLFCVVGHWNEWFSGLIYMQKTIHYPLQTYLQSLLKNMDVIMRLATTDYIKLLSLMSARTGRAAQLFLAALPMMLVYPYLQKYFTTGLVLGSVKG